LTEDVPEKLGQGQKTTAARPLSGSEARPEEKSIAERNKGEGRRAHKETAFSIRLMERWRGTELRQKECHQRESSENEGKPSNIINSSITPEAQSEGGGKRVGKEDDIVERREHTKVGGRTEDTMAEKRENISSA